MVIDKFTFMENANDLIEVIRSDGYQNFDTRSALEMESLQIVIKEMKIQCDLNVESRLLNIGCGNGITSFHAAYDPGVYFECWH